MEFHHIPVLLDETLEGLAIRPDGIYIDATAGGAGHAAAIAKRLIGGRLLALDRDPDAVAIATERLSPYPGAEVMQEDFRNIRAAASRAEIARADGILMDLGVSSHQLDTAERGFSYHAEAPLDMRMSRQGMTAADVVNGYSERELIRVLRDWGEERFAARIAAAIVKRREQRPVETTTDLAELVKGAIPAAARREGGHPAKRSFQALRIEVNGELQALDTALDEAFSLLFIGGRLCVITFHSLEDRMVKRRFADFCKGCTCPPDFPVCVCHNTPRARLIERRGATAGAGELERNNRSRSARLRVIEKLQD